MFSPCHGVCVFVCLFVCLFVWHDASSDDLTIKDRCHTNNALREYRWGCLVVRVMCCTLMTSSKALSGLKNAITWSVFITQRGNKYLHNLWLMSHLSNTLMFRFRFQFKRAPEVQKMKLFSGISKIHVFHMIASVWLPTWKVDDKLCNQWRYCFTLNITLCIHVDEELILGACFKANILGINANIVMIFVCYT